MVTTLKISEDDFESAVDVAHAMLHSGGVFVYPTDTVYGIGCDATNENAVERIHRIKGIMARRPMSVMMPDFGMIEYYCDTGLWEDVILKKYLPGPYTFILKMHKGRVLPATNTDRLGIRMPDHPFCQAVSASFGRPIVSTSANITSRLPATKLGDIDRSVLDAVDLVIDGGPTKYRSPSVIIDLVERKMMREGASDKISLIELPGR